MASRYLVATGNYNDNNSWAATSGGAGGASFPTSADDVFLDANSGTFGLTVNVASAALTFVCTGYTGTLTMTAGLTVSGNVTLVSAMTIAGASGLSINATATLTSNTKIWPNALTLTGTSTITLADDWNVDGLLTIGASTLSTTVNSGSIYASDGYTAGGTTGDILGTLRIVMDGTGTIQMSAKTTGTNQVAIDINTTGTITIGTIAQTVNPITYIRGVLVDNIVGLPKTIATVF